MSPRAACRLAQLGATDVHDYAGGKLDWLARGLPYEGDADLVSRHLAEAPTCTAEDSVVVVAGRVDNDAFCVLIGPDRVVLGTLTDHELLEHGDAVAGDVARYGPTTVRPSEERGALDERMAAKDVARIIVTDPAGRLLGVYRR